MNPFEQMQSLADLWGKSGKAFATAQQGLFSGMADTMAKAAGAGDHASFQAFAPDTQGFEAARQDFSKLWSSASELSAALTKNMQGADQANPLMAEMLAKIFDPHGWFSATNEVDEALQRMAEGPRLADLWNVERKFMAVFNAWVAMRRRSLEHNTVMLEAWMKAAGAFAKTSTSAPSRAKRSIPRARCSALWVETANEILLETQRSEAFLKTQRELLKASTDLRLAQQELAEFYSEMFGYPTRAELDDVHKTVTELRRELRAFKRESRARVRPPRARPVQLASAAPDHAGATAPRSASPPRHERLMSEPACPSGSSRSRRSPKRPPSGRRSRAAPSCSGRSATRTSRSRRRPRTRSGARTRSPSTAIGPLAEQKVTTPVLIVYGLVGRYTMADLQEDRSLVRNLLKLGVDLYVVDWGNPSRADRWLTLDDYIDGYLGECVEFIRERHGIDKVNLLGICEGGVFTTCYAALHPENVKNLVLTITPVDFHADASEERLGFGFINFWTRSLKPEDIDRLIEAHGNLPGDLMGSVFSMMTPMRTLTKYNLDLLEVMDDKKKLLNFLRMEKWIADRPHHPGEAAKQWLKDLYQDNKLVKGELELGGRKVDLKNITMPVLNVFAKDDHIIPPATTQALRLCVGSKDYQELPLPGGHVGVFVGGKSQGLLGPGIANWLAEHDQDAAPKHAHR